MLAETGKADKMKTDGNLAMPITNIRDEMRKQNMSG